MAAEFQILPTKNFGRGEDARSTPNAIPPGFAESVVNMNTSPKGWAQTRKGYQGYYGWIPLRANRVEHDGTEIRLRFDTSQVIDLTTTPIGPLVIYGKLSAAQSGDFTTTNACHYYPYFNLSGRQSLLTGSGTITLGATDHGLGTYNMLVDMATAEDANSRNWTYFHTDSIDINQATTDVELDYTVTSNETGFVWYLARDAEPGVTHIESVVAQTSVAIDAATHQLDNFSLIVRCFDTSVAGTSSHIWHDTATIDDLGEVTVTFSSAFTGDIIITSVGALQRVVTTAAAGSNTISIPDLTSPWVFVSVYAYNASSSTFEQVIPDSMVYDDDLAQIDIGYTLATGSENVEVYYEYGDTISNAITIQDSGGISATYSDSEPQITVWGISHEEIYSAAAERGGHVKHLDVYRRADEERAICSLGGNVYSAQTRAEAGTEYLMPTLYAKLRSRVDGDVNLAPLFQATGSTASRTRGLVLDASISSNLARVTAASYVSAGVVDYTLSFTNKTGALAIAGRLDVTDYLTVSGLAWAGHNGEFLVQSIQSDSTTQTVVRVANAAAYSTDFNETSADGRAGVFTDRFTVDAVPDFLTGDRLLSTSIGASLTATMRSFTLVEVTVAGITGQVMLPDGVQVFGRRVASVFPLRTTGGIASTTNLVRGDMLAVTDLARQVRVNSVNTGADITLIGITGDGETATATTGVPHLLSTGQQILLMGTSYYDGAWTITATPSTSTFEFETTITTFAPTGRVVGETVALDEALTVQDGNSAPTQFTVVGRWLPVEMPATPAGFTDTLSKKTKVTHLDANDYTDQPRLRSSSVASSMYLTNGDDEVLKFDGTSLYQAGLFRWQPQLFSQVDTTTGSITIDTTSAASTAWAGNKFTCAIGAGRAFSVGQRIQRSTELDVFTIKSISDNGSTSDYIYVDRDISGATAARTLSVVNRFSYYFRLRAIDANQNVVASAATGASDCVLELSAAAQIKHRLVGMPAFTGYDFSRLELDVFRTKGSVSSVFYHVMTKQLSFAAGAEYIDVTDTTPDELLLNADTVSTALLGAELGTAWDQPLRAKAVTTLGSKLVLANLKGYPEFDITLRRTNTAVTTADLSGKKWLFRKDSADTSTTSNLTDRQCFEFVTTSAAVTIAGTGDITNNSGASFTVDEVAHGLIAGNWVYLYHAAPEAVNSLMYAGWWQIASATADAFTITFAHDAAYTATDAADVNRYVSATAKVDIPVLVGTDGNYNTLTGNPTTSYEFPAMLRLANAINASQRANNTTSFVPWLTAHAGSEYNAGQLVVRQPQVFDTTAELVLPTFAATVSFEVFVNSLLRASAEVCATFTPLFPSRIIASYENYPEIFDAPAGAPEFSDSAIDVNAADGQEITAVIPFLGVASFGAGQYEGKLLALKTASLYQVDLKTKQYQKIEQPYGGCTAPASVCQTLSGIMFANESGIYRLNSDLTVTWVGAAETRRWKEEVNQDRLEEAEGHNYLNGSQYKLSVPVGFAEQHNNQVFAYDYTEAEADSWVRHTNHPVTGWANIGTRGSLFGAQTGQVFKIRSTNDTTDYRDDDEAIEAELVTRAEDFDMPGVRKIVSGVHVEFFNDGEPLTGVTVSTAADMSTEFAECDPLDITTSSRKLEGAWFSPAKRKLTRIQTKIECSTLDAPMTVAGIAYRATALDPKGAKEAAQL